jgi:hypothetical protein
MTHSITYASKRNFALGFAAAAFAVLLLPKASHAMTISPPTLDFTLNPGDVVSDVVQVYNEEGVPFKIRPVGVNFYTKEGDETLGAPEFYPADEVRNGYELAPWFEIGSEATVIPPNERINIPFSIRVPENASPGSHFGAIQILASRPDEIDPLGTSSVEIERGTSVLIFVRVTGDVRDELTVEKFGPAQDVYSHLPVDFTVRLMNGGTTHQRPVGNVIIKDMWGRQVASLVVNPGPQFRAVLPGSARRFDVTWARKKLPDGTGEYESQLRNFALGKYTATLLVNYGSADAQKSITAVSTFVVIPWLALLTYVGAGLVALLIVLFGARGYNRMVIRRYESSKKQQKP